MTKSILTYRVTKVFGSKRAATFIGQTVAGHSAQKDKDVRVTRLGARRWEMAVMVQDVFLDEVKPFLGERYGIQTFSTEG